LRIGYGISTSEIIGYINRIRGPFNVTTAAQKAALAAFNDNEFVEASFNCNKESKEYTYEKCKALDLPYIETYGNFIMIDFKVESLELFEKLQKRGIILRPGFFFGMPTYQRVTLGTKEQMEKLFETYLDIIS